jgi:hypothetical protein
MSMSRGRTGLTGASFGSSVADSFSDVHQNNFAEQLRLKERSGS